MKKLKLNKETISSLNNEQISNVYGGNVPASTIDGSPQYSIDVCDIQPVPGTCENNGSAHCTDSQHICDTMKACSFRC